MNDYFSWTEVYIKHRLLFRGLSSNIIIDGKIITVNSPKESEVYIIVGTETLDYSIDEADKLTQKYDKVWLVLANNDMKLKETVACWDILESNKKIRLIFVDLVYGRKWALNPFAHGQIVNKSKLKTSLDALSAAI